MVRRGSIPPAIQAWRLAAPAISSPEWSQDFVAQNPEHVFEAVVAAVFLHGLAGDVARDTVGEYSLTATDLLTASFPKPSAAPHASVNATSVQMGG